MPIQIDLNIPVPGSFPGASWAFGSIRFQGAPSSEIGGLEGLYGIALEVVRHDHLRLIEDWLRCLAQILRSLERATGPDAEMEIRLAFPWGLVDPLDRSSPWIRSFGESLLQRIQTQLAIELDAVPRIELLFDTATGPDDRIERLQALTSHPPVVRNSREGDLFIVDPDEPTRLESEALDHSLEGDLGSRAWLLWRKTGWSDRDATRRALIDGMSPHDWTEFEEIVRNAILTPSYIHPRRHELVDRHEATAHQLPSLDEGAPPRIEWLRQQILNRCSSTRGTPSPRANDQSQGLLDSSDPPLFRNGLQHLQARIDLALDTFQIRCVNGLAPGMDTRDLEELLELTRSLTPEGLKDNNLARLAGSLGQECMIRAAFEPTQRDRLLSKAQNLFEEDLRHCTEPSMVNIALGYITQTALELADASLARECLEEEAFATLHFDHPQVWDARNSGAPWVTPSMLDLCSYLILHELQVLFLEGKVHPHLDALASLFREHLAERASRYPHLLVGKWIALHEYRSGNTESALRILAGCAPTPATPDGEDFIPGEPLDAVANIRLSLRALSREIAHGDGWAWWSKQIGWTPGTDTPDPYDSPVAFLILVRSSLADLSPVDAITSTLPFHYR